MSCECSLSPLLKSQDICLYLTRLPSSMARLSETSEAEINVAGVNQGGQSGTKWDKYGALFTSFLSQKILKVPRLFPENSKMCPIKIPDFPQKSPRFVTFLANLSQYFDQVCDPWRESPVLSRHVAICVCDLWPRYWDITDISATPPTPYHTRY